MLILRNQEDHGLCSYSSVCSHPENSWVKNQFVHPFPPRRSVHIHDGLFSHLGVTTGVTENAHCVADVTEHPCTGRAEGRHHHSMHLSRLLPRTQGSMRKAKSLSE